MYNGAMFIFEPDPNSPRPPRPGPYPDMMIWRMPRKRSPQMSDSTQSLMVEHLRQAALRVPEFVDQMLATSTWIKDEGEQDRVQAHCTIIANAAAQIVNILSKEPVK